jgi:hypothetical protein
MTWDLPALIPIRPVGVLRILSPLKSIALAGFEPATFGSSGKHTNHYTTKAIAFGGKRYADLNNNKKSPRPWER